MSPLCGIEFCVQGVAVTTVVMIDYFHGREAAEVAEVAAQPAPKAADPARMDADFKRRSAREAFYKVAGARLAASNVGLDDVQPWSAPLIERTLESDLRRVCNRVTGKYYMVVGPRGCGKTSTAVAATCGWRDGTTLTPSPGVLLLRANRGEDTVKHILRMLAPHDATKYAFDEEVESADLDTLTPVFKAAIQAHKSQVVVKADKSSEPAASGDGWVPTVIIDVDRNLMPDDVADVCRVAKLLACEKKIAAVVLVLSDAGYYSHGVPPDSSRQARAHMPDVVLGWPVVASVLVLSPRIAGVSCAPLSPACFVFLHPVQTYLWLGNFTEQEADAFLDTLELRGGPRVTPEERREVYSRVGTRAVVLESLTYLPAATERKGTPADWLYEALAPDADTQVKQFLDPLLEPARHSERVRLLQDLLDGKSTHRAPCPWCSIGRCGVVVQRARGRGWCNVSPRGPHLRSRHSRAWLRCVVEVKGRDVSMMHNAFMKSNSANAVVYNLDTNQWQLASPVHRQAAVRCP